MVLSFLDRLRQELHTPQRTKKSRTAYAAELAYGRWRGPAPQSAKQAAVIVLLCGETPFEPAEAPLDRWQFPLTLRPHHLPRHGGQISLPGGELQTGETHWQAAVRELEEELGVAKSSVVQLGTLSPYYVFASHFVVTPVVGLTLSKPSWQPQVSEVAEVFEMSLRHLLHPTNKKSPLQERGGIAFRAPCILLENRQIWGATCLILGELIAALHTAEQTNSTS